MGIEFDGEAILDGLAGAAGGGYVIVAIGDVLTVSGVAEGSGAGGIILDNQGQSIRRK